MATHYNHQTVLYPQDATGEFTTFRMPDDEQIELSGAVIGPIDSNGTLLLEKSQVYRIWIVFPDANDRGFQLKFMQNASGKQYGTPVLTPTGNATIGAISNGWQVEWAKPEELDYTLTFSPVQESGKKVQITIRPRVKTGPKPGSLLPAP